MEPQRYLTKTAGLTIEARAAYSYLVQHAWVAGNQGEPPASVPDDDAVLARISGVGSRWKKVRKELTPFFDSIAGRWVERELLDLWHEQQASYKRRRAAGMKGGRGRRASQGNSNAKALRQHSESELEVKRSPFGGGALPLKLERGGAGESDLSMADRAEHVATWVRENPERAEELRTKALAGVGVPTGKRGEALSPILQALYENAVLAELQKASTKRSGNG